jgi:hypothetical protein
MLISMPTGTSMIFGAFQAIWLSFLEPDAFRPLRQVNAERKVRQRNLFPASSNMHLCCIAKGCAGPMARMLKTAPYQQLQELADGR